MSYFNISRPPVREYAGGSVGGILRKGGSSSNTTPNNGVYTNYASTSSTTGLNAGEARQVDLLVFGYACKLFRDDDKAREIDQGKHMIPWMGDTALKIDRYDVRGALSELAPHEPPPGGYGNRLDYLSAEEQRAEQLCEEERYLYLYNNEEDHILQQEEDLKRLKQDVEGGNYAQVDFQYGNDGGAGVTPHGPNREEHSNSPNGEEAEQAFSLPKGFEVPITIQLPETMKQHAIIEKTARFIASQGMQMEILLKAKQSNNIQFEFLAINGVLNPYYKYILNALKNGSYPAESTISSPNSHTEQTAANSRDTASSASVSAKPIITVPTIKYKPSANCAYTQLISKIKGVPLPAVIDGELANMPTSNSPTPTTTVAASTNFTPVLLQYNGNTFVSADAEEGTNSNSNTQMNGVKVRTEVELLKNSSALTLAQDYASDTESEEEKEEEKVEEPPRMKTPPPPKFGPILNFPVPTETLKNIIDKTASYVIKNGRQFEETLRAKSVDRFTFLLYDNEHYPYYLYKVTGDADAASKEQKQRKAAAVAAALMSKKKLLAAEKSISPVCFSIKAKDDPSTTMLQPALPREPSDDDEESTTKHASSAQTRTVPEHVQKAIQLVESQLMARNAQIAATVGSRNTSNALLASPALLAMVAPSNPPTTGRFDTNYNGSSSATNTTKLHLKSTKAELERNALFEQQTQNRQKELKKAEEKVKDKLAKIAREKLGAPISKEKQLQLERKRKAMAFLNQIKDSPSTTTSGKNSPNDAEKSNANATDSEESVHSIPITSYGPEDDGKSDEEEKQRLIEIPTTHIAGEMPAVTLINPMSTPAKDDESNVKSATTVTVSDDDDVELISEIKPISRPSIPKQRKDRKRQLRSRTRDSSEDAKSKLSTKHTHKRKHRRRSRSSSESSEEDDDSSSSSESTSSSSSSASTSTSTTATASSTSDDSTDMETVKRSRSRSHRKHKTSTKTKSAKKHKKQKLSKPRKLSSRNGHKKKSKKRARDMEEYKRIAQEYKDHKERARKRERSRKHKREQEHAEQIYERESERHQIERSKKHSRQRSETGGTPTDDAYEQQQRRLQRAQHRAEIEASARREYEHERQREREHRERRKQRDRELERERDRSIPPPPHYDTPARKEKKKKRER